MKLPSHFLLALTFLLLCVSTLVYSDEVSEEEYDDYYEDEVEETVGGTSIPAQKQPTLVAGFHKNVGGGVHQVTIPFLDEEYLNLTAEVFDCVKRVDSGILALEPNSTEDEEPDITQQVNDLRKKMEEVVSVAAALANGTDSKPSNSTSNDTSSGIVEEIPSSQSSKVKRLSFREKQELRMKERREQEAAREQLRPKFRLGADCETLVCGACKAIVEEFGVAVKNAVNNASIQYIEEVSFGMCERKEIKLKYIDLVTDVCKRIEQVRLFVLAYRSNTEFHISITIGVHHLTSSQENSGYKEALLQPFEQDDQWDKLLTPAGINPKKQKVEFFQYTHFDCIVAPSYFEL